MQSTLFVDIFILQIILFSILHLDILIALMLCLCCVGVWVAAAVFVRAVAERYARKICCISCPAVYANSESHHIGMVDLCQTKH